MPIESYTTINILKKDNLPIHKKTIITIHKKGQQYMCDGIFDGTLLIRLNYNLTEYSLPAIIRLRLRHQAYQLSKSIYIFLFYTLKVLCKILQIALLVTSRLIAIQVIKSHAI